MALICLSVYQANSQEIDIEVQGECGMCQDRIETTALNVIGVTTASWDEDTKILHITYEKGLFDEMELHKAIAAVGHDTPKVKADKSVYNSLPKCCMYRAESPQLVGHVTERIKNKKENLIGANVYWADNPSMGTNTDADGAFALPMVEGSTKLVISYIGYENDTLNILKAGHVNITMQLGTLLNEVTIERRKPTTTFSYVETIKVQKITSKELMKAACCNLSESFETNPSVDASFTDAVTGTRTIEMLGLAGPYVQITRELIPDIRGLSALSGFTYIPGPWVEGIQLNQGVGSVLSGYESVAGQINVELKKPWDKEKLYLNGYANVSGRYEANAIANTTLSDKWQTNGMLHYAKNLGHNDRNNDGFLDMPTGQNFIAANTWKMNGDNGNEGMIGVKLTKSTGESGQDHNTFDHASGTIWTADNNTDRYELWMKRGKVFESKPYQSIGFQMGSVYHDATQTFGNTLYTGVQKSIYGNLLFQTIIKDTDHKIVFGTSFLLDHYDERVNRNEYKRREYIPGIFSEYTSKLNEKTTFILGLRTDYHNNFGLFVTPRAHVRYALTEQDIFRFVAGRGQRTASIFAENIGAFASSRTWNINGASATNGNPYGLTPEVAWNYGASYQRGKSFSNGELNFSLDYFFTDFQKQVVVDYYQSPNELNIYNLTGASRSHAAQTQLDLTMNSGLDIRLAYRYVDVKTQYTSGILDKQLIAPHRTFLNVAYKTKNNWSFDYTINMQSSKQLPFKNGDNTFERSDRFFLSNAQISKGFNKNFEAYIGGENLLNFRQDNPIRNAATPYEAGFDASQVWGPIFGRMLYAGFRYKLEREG